MGSTLWEQLFQNSAFNEENQVVEHCVQYGPSYHKSLHIWMDINSWKKAQKIFYSKLLTVLPSEEKQHFCFDSVLLYYFNFLHGGYIYVLLMLKREIIKRNRGLISLFSSFERNRTRVWMRKTDTDGWQGHRIQGVHFEFCLALRLWTQGRLDRSVLLELLARPPLRWHRGLGLHAGTLSFGCPLFWWCDESVGITTESFPPLSHSPSLVLLSLVSAELQQFVMKGCVFPLWPALATCLPVFLLLSETS